MSLPFRFLPILPLALALSFAASAQEAPAPGDDLAPPAGEPTESSETLLGGDFDAADPYEVRNELGSLLREHPRDLARVLGLLPPLLGNDELLGGYPELQRFVAAHPEVLRNPHFYLEPFRDEPRDRGLGDVIETVAILGSFTLVTLAMAWFVRTVVDQRRWYRLAQTQSEVHNKILDRFGSSEEVLAYIRSPAGARFLESAPIPVRPPREEDRSPVGRAIRTVQIGVVVLAAAIGLLLLSWWLGGESTDGLFALGVLGASVGVGFLASAAVSISLSRRLGVWSGPLGGSEDLAGRSDEPGLVP